MEDLLVGVLAVLAGIAFLLVRVVVLLELVIRRGDGVGKLPYTLKDTPENQMIGRSRNLMRL